MKCVNNNLADTSETITIIPIADTHIGSPKCDVERIKSVVKYIAETDGVYAMLGGDLLNMALKNSVSDIYSEVLSPMEAAKMAVDLLKPIKHKILGAVSGNHCLRSVKDAGLDIMYWICVELGIESKYDADSVVSLVRFGPTLGNGHSRSCYSIYLSHGDGINGGTMGAKMNGLQRRGDVVNADVIVTAHTHSPATFKTASWVIDYANSNVVLREVTFVNCGAWLQWESYCERRGMKPSSTAMPTIKLYAKAQGKDKKYIEVHL